MTNIHKHRAPQQILDYYPHPIPQPDTEEARQARIGQRFRLYFLLDIEKKLLALGKKKAGAARTEKARELLPQVEAAHALMVSPPNRFLIKDHARHVDYLLSDLHAIIG